MLRKVAIFVVTAGLTMSPLAVQALGFGGIKLKSSLNEKLNAEVILSSATADDIQSLSIKLASEEAFLRSGIERAALLNKLKFNVKQRSNGDYYIHLTTSATVREPFMNFLLEMNWKNGRMLREYTMLIDPPRRAPRPAEPAPVVAEILAPEPEVVEVEPEMESVAVEVEEPTPFVEPITLPEPVVEAEPEPEMVEDVVVVAEAPLESYAPEAEETMPVVEVEPEAVIDIEPEPEFIAEPEVIIEPEMLEPTAIADVAADDVAPTQVFEEEAPAEIWPSIPLAAFDRSDDDVISEEAPVMEDMAVVENETGDLDYGIIKKNDNLWNIAEKLRNGNEDVSVYQVMMALLQNNPDAFTNNNVHRLKVGHVLRIDDESELTRLSRKEAASAFIEQTNAWDDYRQQAVGEASIQPIMAGDTDVEDQLSDTNASGELTLSSPDGESLTTGGGLNEESLSNDLATMQDQLRQAKADSGTMRTRNVALNNKLQSLEDELNRLQRSMSVKDDELAALQQQLSQLGNTNTTEIPAAEPEPVVAEMPEVETAPVQEEPVVTESATADIAEPSEPSTIDAAIEAKPNPVELAEKIANEEAADSATSNSDAGIMDTVMGMVASIGVMIAGVNLGGDSLLFIGAPVLLVLLIIAVIVIKRRRQGDNFQESILTGTASAAEGTDTPSADTTAFSEESSFLSDFAMSGASAIEADDSEVDPLTEADVFMAYGRYEAAEERLNEAVQSDPNRMELRAKLLELYHATQNKVSFESAAEDFYAGLGGNEAESPLWTKVVEMGREVAPENPLFSQGDAAAPAASNIQETNETAAIEDPGMAMTDSQVMDIGLETGVFAAADLNGSADELASDDLDFNLDLGDMGDLGTSTTEDAASTETATPETDDIAMDFNIGGDESEEAEPAADLDFNLDMGTEEESGGLDLDLDSASDEVAEVDAGLDFNLDMGTEAAEDVATDSDVSSPEEASLDFDLDMGSDESESLDFNLDASDTADGDMGGSDEVGTKLDLAKAYIDMGDPEGARSILDEVMDEGSSTQKEEAQSLLGQIA
ncbi:MAG: FimV/HubP family polar landmark protein [Woeseiaceae bacterium]